MRNEDYLAHYRTLGIPTGCTWGELRDEYRILMQRWHPDRFPADSPERVAAEDKVKQITQAFAALARFFRRHGSLPLASSEPANDKGAGFTDTSTPKTSESSPYRHPGPRRKHRVPTSIFVALSGVAMALTLWLAHEREAITFAPAPLTTPDRAPSAPVSPHSFTVGSPMTDVYRAQGAPDAIDGDVWIYGTSRVYFRNGRVARWETGHNDSLNARWSTRATDTPSHFTIGSSKAEVVRVQGQPSRVIGDAWDYGVSRVYFSDGKVIGWDNSPLTPLKAKR